MNYFIIDVETWFKRRIVNRLKTLKSSYEVKDGGEYNWDRNFSQIHIATTKTEGQLNDWFYNYGIGYIGVCVLKGVIE